MATYKVLQDIESEDKLLGTLTLRQFIYAAITLGIGGVGFLLSKITVFLVIPLLPPMALFALLAAPIGKDQSSEIWLLAKIRFALKPQKRIWDQSGLKELVTITVPKKIERQLTNGLSQTEVKSRLQALANTIDSRGWAVKNVNVNLFAQPAYALGQNGTDRLIDPSSLGRNVPQYDTQAIVDVLDQDTSATAQKFDQLISSSEQARREQLLANMRQPQPVTTAATPPADYWFMNQTPVPNDGSQAAFASAPVIAPASEPSQVMNQASTTADEEALLEKIHKAQDAPDPVHNHLKTIEPLSAHNQHKSHTKQPTMDRVTETKITTPEPTPQPVTAPTDPAILGFAQRDDLDVATIARQLNKSKLDASDGEVVISLR